MIETTRWINLREGGQKGGGRYTPAFVVEYENDEFDSDYFLSRGQKAKTAISEDSLKYEVMDVSLLGPVDEELVGEFVAGYLPDSKEWLTYRGEQQDEDLAGLFEYEGPQLLETETVDDWLDTPEGEELQRMVEQLGDNGLVRQELGW